MVPWAHWREPRLGRLWTVLTSELTRFNPGIRVSNGKPSAFFASHPIDCSVEQFAAVPGFTFFSKSAAEHRGNLPFFQRCSRD